LVGVVSKEYSRAKLRSLTANGSQERLKTKEVCRRAHLSRIFKVAARQSLHLVIFWKRQALPKVIGLSKRELGFTPAILGDRQDPG